MKDQLTADHKSACAKSEDVKYLQGDIDLWKATAAELRHDYEEAIHSITPETVGKHWVKNIDKPLACQSHSPIYMLTSF